MKEVQRVRWSIFLTTELLTCGCFKVLSIFQLFFWGRTPVLTCLIEMRCTMATWLWLVDHIVGSLDLPIMTAWSGLDIDNADLPIARTPCLNRWHFIHELKVLPPSTCLYVPNDRRKLGKKRKEKILYHWIGLLTTYWCQRGQWSYSVFSRCIVYNFCD